MSAYGHTLYDFGRLQPGLIIHSLDNMKIRRFGIKIEIIIDCRTKINCSHVFT